MRLPSLTPIYTLPLVGQYTLLLRINVESFHRRVAIIQKIGYRKIAVLAVNESHPSPNVYAIGWVYQNFDSLVLQRQIASACR